jgi:hypothetical protein
MGDAIRKLVFFALAALVLCGVAWLIAVWMRPWRRLRRALKRVLGAHPDAEALAPAQGRAAGLHIHGASLAVLWDMGDSGLVYRLEEIEGAELIVDGEVAARVRRSEPGRPLERLNPKAERVALRLIFADPRHPDFELELKGEGDAEVGAALPAEEVIRQGRRWLAHVDSILKRRAALRSPEPARPEPARTEPPRAPPPSPPAPPPGPDQPPWEEDEEADDAERP